MKINKYLEFGLQVLKEIPGRAISNKWSEFYMPKEPYGFACRNNPPRIFLFDANLNKSIEIDNPNGILLTRSYAKYIIEKYESYYTS